MHRMRTAILMVGATLVAALAVLALMSATTSAGEPKPEPTGPLSGILDITIPATDDAANELGGAPDGTCNDSLDNDGDTVADGYDVDCHNKAVSLFHCITKQDHDALDNQVKTASMCYQELQLSPGPSAVPDLPGEAPDMLWREPPPPPYTGGEGPGKGNGVLAKPANDLTVTTCFPTEGRDANIVAVTSFPNTLGQEALNGGKVGGTLDVYLEQSDAACASKIPVGDPALPDLPIQTERIGDQPGGQDFPPTRDHDTDGCTDWDELDKSGTAKCGDDPYNPYDSNATDIGGSYSLTAIVLEPDLGVPGVVYTCYSDIQHETGTNDLDAAVLCYIDIAGIPVNPEAGVATGDGYSGFLPATSIPATAAAETGVQCQNGVDDDADDVIDDGCPAIFADVPAEQHVLLEGTLNKQTNTIDIEGCFDDADGQSPVGNVYIRTIGLDVHTLMGQVEIWTGENPGGTDCGAGPWTPGTGAMAQLTAVRNSDKADNRDTDGDACPDKAELGNDETDGGLRDPSNHWDYFNPTHDGLNRVDDILAVVSAYFVDLANPSYSAETDRTALAGSNGWNFGPPNGQQRVDDILAAVKSYFHDCLGGSLVDDDTLYPSDY